ncbi:glpK, partial [Symbiodinium pilosum]
DTGGLTLVPAFSGLFAPHWRDDARAVAVGMTLFTSKEHMCRAALESTAFQAVDIMEAMKQDTGLRILDMRVDGGMTINNLLMQMQADILGMSVLRSKLAEATALGAALAAGLSVGFYEKKEVVTDIIEKAGGYEVFKASTTPAARRKMMQRWK